jgi:DNA-directed RNA polymerase specialized sigma24 family protein
MNCLKTKDFGNVKAKNRYATSEDFCRVYRDNLDSLYLLSFLLTGDQRKAEQCFLAGLEESIRVERVFKDWAQRWVKVTIIRYTIAALQPRPEDTGSSFDDTIPAEESELSTGGAFELYRVRKLPDFVRFVFVLSVLEQYTEHDCAQLLGCSLKEIQSARIRALELIAIADLSASTRGTGSANLQEMTI